MKNNPINHFRSALRLLTVICVGCAALSQAQAASFWDADGVAPLNDGAGAWNATGGTNWNTGDTYGAWGNSTADEAIFGAANGAAGSITVGTVNANKITFNAPGSGTYLLSGGTITLGGASPTITVNANARIDSTLTSTAANAFIRGTGTLTLGGAAAFTGEAALEGIYRYVPGSSSGTVAVVSGANVAAKNFQLMQDGGGSASGTQYYNQTGGTFTVSGEFGLGGATTGGTSGCTNTATISGGTLTVNTSLNLYKWATSILNVNNAGTVNATSVQLGWGDSNPTGTINVGDGTTFSGGTSIQDGGTSGVLNVNAWDVRNNRSYTLNIKGGTLKAGAGGTNWLPANTFSTTAGANVQEAGGIIDNGGYAITIAQALKHGGVAATDGGLIFKGSGTTTLTGAVSYTGPTVVAGGTLAGTTTLGNVTVANAAALEGGAAGNGTLTAADVTLGSGASDITALKGKLSPTAGSKAIAVTNLVLNGGNGTVTLDVSGTGLTNGNTYDLLVSANPISTPHATSVLAALKTNARAFTPVVSGDLKKIQVLYDASASIYWTGASGTPWNTVASNWKLSGNNAATQFQSGDVVYFHTNPVSDIVDISGANVSPSATTFDNTSATAYTLQGTHGIATGTINKSGNGMVTITNTNPTSGAVAINGGTLSISQTGGLGTGDLTFDGGSLDYTGATATTWARNFTTNAGGGTLAVSNGTLTLGGVLGGSGVLTKTGTGTLNLSTLSAGSTLILDGGTTYCNTGDAIKGNLQINSGASCSNTIAHIFKRPEARVWINGGTLTHGPAGYPEYYLPQGTSPTDPGLKMTGGTLAGGGQNRFDKGDGYITTYAATTTALISGDTTNYQGGSQTYTVAAGAVTEGVYPGVDLEFTGWLAFDFGGGTTNVTKSGAGVMEIRGNVPFSNNANGIFTVTEGIVRLTGTNAVTNFGGSGVALDAANPATLQLNAVNPTDSLTFSKAISGGSASATVAKIGDGNVTFSTAKTYLGATRINAGTLTLQGNLNAAGSITVADNATLSTNTNDVAVGGISVSSGGTLSTGTPAKSLAASTLTFDGTATLEPAISEGATPIIVTDLTVYGGVGSIKLLPSGSGLVNGNSYNVLTFSGASNITDASAFISGIRALTPSYDAGTKTLKVTYDANTAIVWSGAESENWDLTAANNWKLNGITPTRFMNSDVVEFPTNPGGSTTVGIWDANVFPSATTFSNTSATTYTVDGLYGIASGQLTKTNNGTVILTTSNTYTGVTTISGGTLQLGNASYNGTLSPLSVITNDANLTFYNNSGALVQGIDFSNSGIGGSGSLTKAGTSQLTLNVANSYSGGTTVSQGSLQLEHVDAVGTNGAITLGDVNTADNNVTLVTKAGEVVFTNPITVSAANTGTGTVTIAQASNYSVLSGLLALDRPTTIGSTIGSTAGDRTGVSGKITGNVGTLTFAGGRTTMSQDVDSASDFTGNVVIASGTLQINTDSYGLPSTASVTVNSGAIFRLLPADGKSQLIDALNGAGQVFNDAGRNSLDPVWTGTLSLGNSGGSGNFSGKLVNGSGNDILALAKEGAGTQILSGNNTYSGATTVNGGILQIDGVKSGGGATTVKAAATLAGSGSVSGTTTVEAGGFAAPGNTAIGTLTLASAILSGTYQCQLGATAGDQVMVAGMLTVNPGASINISTLAAPTAAVYTIATYGDFAGDLPTVTGVPAGYLLDTDTPGEIRLVSTATSGYNAWANSFPGLTDATPGSDPDGDGIANLIEYVIGGDPRVSSTQFLPQQSIVGANLVLSYQRSDDSEADTTQIGQWSTNLTDWNDIAPVRVNENGTNPDDMTISIPLANAVDGKLFGRLVVSQP